MGGAEYKDGKCYPTYKEYECSKSNLPENATWVSVKTGKNDSNEDIVSAARVNTDTMMTEIKREEDSNNPGSYVYVPDSNSTYLHLSEAMNKHSLLRSDANVFCFFECNHLEYLSRQRNPSGMEDM